MKYIKSAGCFSLFYVILYFILSTGMGIFITNTYLFTTLFYGILLIAAFLYLKICGDDTKKTLRMYKIHIGSFFLVILLAFTIRPVAGFITMIARCYNQHYDTESDAESWIISFYNRFSSRSCGRDTVPWSTLFQTAKSQSHQRNLIICFAFWYSSYELSAVFLCILFGYRIWMLIRSNGFHFCNHNCSHDF